MRIIVLLQEIEEKNPGRIRNTSLFLRLYAGTIRNAYDPEHLLVLKALRGDDTGHLLLKLYIQRIFCFFCIEDVKEL